MKLVEQDEHILPEDPGEKPPFYIKFTSRLLSKTMSSGGLTIMVGIGLFLLLTVTLSMNYMDSSRYVDENGISLQDFYAEFPITVEDQAETQKKIEKAKQQVKMVYKDPGPINAEVNDNLRELTNNIMTLFHNPEKTREQKEKEFLSLTEESPEATRIFNQLISEELDEDYWEKIRMITLNTANKILEEGLSLNDYLDNRDRIIRDHMPRYGLSREDYNLVYFLINQRLDPNRVEDYETMEKRRAEAAANVEPVVVTFAQGQTVVEKGERVTEVQKAALQKMGKAVIGKNWIAGMGVMFLCLLTVLTLWSYLYVFEDRRFFKPSYGLLAGSLILATVILFQLLVYYHQTSPAIRQIPIYGFPLATLALTLSIFTHYRLGVVATTLVVFLVGLTLNIDFYSLSILLFGSIAGIYVLSRRLNTSDRSQLMTAGLFVSLINAIVIIAIQLLPTAAVMGLDNDLVSIRAVGWGFASGMLSGILTLGILPLLESVFRLVTPYTLMELSNHDKPLLRRMQFEAPGTFHHSLMVTTLAETAAEAIGANPLLTRVGCLYHDIGKMKRPLFFIENQAYFGAENPHDKLTPRLSKMVITAHPRDGIEMGRQHHLPEEVIHFMTEHHGTMAATYFYNKACQEEGAENVNKSQFRYPGPKPASKETAIVMLADACESAVRALKTPTVSQIEERIDKIIQQRVDDGQFDECPLTFKDISIIKQTFVRVLRGIQHNRIEYQQNIMRDLGRRSVPRPDTDRIQEMVNEIRKSGSGGETGGGDLNAEQRSGTENP